MVSACVGTVQYRMDGAFVTRMDRAPYGSRQFMGGLVDKTKLSKPDDYLLVPRMAVGMGRPRRDPGPPRAPGVWVSGMNGGRSSSSARAMNRATLPINVGIQCF